MDGLYVPIDKNYQVLDTLDDQVSETPLVHFQEAERMPMPYYSTASKPARISLGVERVEPVPVTSYHTGDLVFGFMLPYSNPIFSAHNIDALRYAEDFQTVDHHEHWHIFFPDEWMNRVQTYTTDLSLLSQRAKYGP